MCTKTKIAAAAFAALMAPPLHCAAAPLHADRQVESPPQWSANVISGAYAATTKSRRATAPASRRRVPQAIGPSIGATTPDGRNLGTDPDAAIRFQLRRDSSMGSTMGGGGNGM